MLPDMFRNCYVMKRWCGHSFGGCCLNGHLPAMTPRCCRPQWDLPRTNKEDTLTKDVNWQMSFLFTPYKNSSLKGINSYEARKKQKGESMSMDVPKLCTFDYGVFVYSLYSLRLSLLMSDTYI